MRNRTLVVLLLAIACGAVAGYSALQLLRRQPANAVVSDESSSRLQVVVARRELPAGHIIGEEDVRLVDWPSDAVPEGYARTIPDVVGRGLVQAALVNETLLDAKLASRGTAGGLPILVPEGYRAFTIRVDEVVGVAGFINPGTRVDVLLTMDAPGGRADPVTRIVLQNMMVLARAQSAVPDETGQPIVVSTVTLSVTPEQAEQLGSMMMNGVRIQLALRNPIDVKEVRTTGFAQSSLLSIPGGAPRAASGRPSAGSATPAAVDDGPRTIEIFRGGKRALIRF